MNVLRKKLGIQLLAAAMMFGALSCLIWAWVTPVAVPAPFGTGAVAPVAVQVAPAAADPTRPLPWSDVYARRYQQPLYDPAPDPPAPVIDNTPPPPPIQLLATMPEPDGGHALIQDERGQVSVLRVGAKLTAAGTEVTLLRVYVDRVELEHAGAVLTLPLNVP